ncbi:30S ribosomal protein S18 [Gordonia sp. ABSL1-1]|uniref:30S ribosomal protein S18 n=1 Tax=Gordonia sp. ABSL1-1 TaxID=3053923 RepID=UPI0025723D9D|nr:30S ribosomal protein S18 [Gordonia sp. ABSL1-1]MDL9938265.1 30S ribosomal protein S18 [Gordonia sp. ABSL1-1]
MPSKSSPRRRPIAEPVRRKRHPIADDHPIDYKDIALLRQFLTDRGKIRSRRVTGLSPQQQRQVATAIRNAREMALLPYGSAR